MALLPFSGLATFLEAVGVACRHSHALGGTRASASDPWCVRAHHMHVLRARHTGGSTRASLNGFASTACVLRYVRKMPPLPGAEVSTECGQVVLSPHLGVPLPFPGPAESTLVSPGLSLEGGVQGQVQVQGSRSSLALRPAARDPGYVP